MSVSKIRGLINRKRAGLRYYSSVLRSDPMILTRPKVFHAGIQRSGTNFLRTVLESALRRRVANAVDPQRDHPMHKHFRVQDDQSSVVMDRQYVNDHRFPTLEAYLAAASPDALEDAWPCVVIFKDPVNWLESIMRWGIRCDWIGDEDALLQTGLWTEWLGEYVAYYAKWAAFAEGAPTRVKLVQHEQLILEPDLSLHGLSEFLKTPLQEGAANFVDQVAQSSRRTIEALRDDVVTTPFDSARIGEIYRVTDSLKFGQRFHESKAGDEGAGP